MQKNRREVDRASGWRFLLHLPKEVALASFSAFSRMETSTEEFFKKVAGRDWFILRDLFGGVFEETTYSLTTLFFYPVGLLDWDRNRMATLKKAPRRRGVPAGKRPLLLLHGYFHNNSAYMLLRDRLKKDGWSNIFSINLKTHRDNIQTMAKQVGKAVAMIREKTGHDHVDIIGHSMGGLVARYYVQRQDGHKHVVNCVTLGSPHQGTELAIFGWGVSAKQMSPRGALIREMNSDLHNLTKVWFTAIWSPFDILILPPENATLHDNFVKNVRVNFVGHMGMLFSDRVYKVIKRALEKKEKRNNLFAVPPVSAGVQAP